MKTTHQKNSPGYNHVTEDTGAPRAVGGLTEHNRFNCQGLSSLPVFCLLRDTSLKGTVSIRKKRYQLCASAPQIMADEELLFEKCFKHKFLHSWNMEMMIFTRFA